MQESITLHPRLNPTKFTVLPGAKGGIFKTIAQARA